MKGARINFGVPDSEYVLLTDDDGVAVSLKNQDTDTEYIGGGGDFEKIYSAEHQITYTSSTAGQVLSIDIPAYTVPKFYLISIKDTVSPRVNYFYACIDVMAATSNNYNSTSAGKFYVYDSSLSQASTSSGIYAYSLSTSTNKLLIYAKASASTIIDSTYLIEIYEMDI